MDDDEITDEFIKLLQEFTNEMIKEVLKGNPPNVFYAEWLSKIIFDFIFRDNVFNFYLKKKAEKLGIKPYLVNWESGLDDGYTTEQVCLLINDIDPNFDLEFYKKYKNTKFISGNLKIAKD